MRPWRPGDTDAVWQACQEPLVQRWAAGMPVPYPREAAREFVEEVAPRLLADATGLFLGIFDADGEQRAAVPHRGGRRDCLVGALLAADLR